MQQVLLFPAADRATPTGYATVRGQLLRTSAPAGAPPTVDGMSPDPDGPPHHEVAWLGAPRPDDPTVPTLVLLHGYGSNERDLISLVPAMKMKTKRHPPKPAVPSQAAHKPSAATMLPRVSSKTPMPLLHPQTPALPRLV